MSISYFSFAQGVSTSITDADPGTIDIETTTGSITNKHISCCEPLILDITVTVSSTFESNLFLKIRYFGDNQEYDFTYCEPCSIGEIYDNDDKLVNTEIIIDEMLPAAIPANYEYTLNIEVPYYSTSSGALDIIYGNDQGGESVSNLFIYSEAARCPTDVSKITELTQNEQGDEGWYSPSDMCEGAQFMDNIRPQTDVIIDVDEYCFLGSSGNNVDFNFGPGKQLIVEEGNKLTLDYCHFYTCYGKMWKGIYLEKGAELVMTNSTIEDAEFAITFEKGAKLTLEDNEFTDNYVHMKALSVRIVEDTGDETEISSFKNNEFSGSGSLASTYDGQTTTPQEYPYAGILIGDGSAGWRTCGTLRFTTDNVADRNKFSYLANGILNQRDGGNLFLKGSTFYEINSTSGIGYSTSGFGIRHDAMIRPCIVNGFSSWPDEYSFKNVETALRTNYASIVKFHKQKVTDSDRGVHSTKTLSSSYINDNVIFTDYNAIEINNTYPFSDFEILNNYVKIEHANYPEQPVCIALSNVRCKDGENRGMIKDNSLYVDEGYAGLAARNTHNLDIKGNYFAGTDNQINYKGMIFNGGSNHVINCNEVKSHYTGDGASTESRAIEIAGLTNTLIQCNSVSYTEVGLQVFGNCSHTQFKGNATGNHAYGIRYGYSEVDAANYAQTGIQDYNGNRWLNNYNTGLGEYGALHFDLDNYRLSQYQVNDISSSLYTTTDLPNNFVVELNDEANYQCDIDSCNTFLSAITGYWDKLDSIAMLDTGLNHTYQVSILWDLQWQALRRMKEGWLPNNSNFLQLAQQKGLVDIYNGERELASRVRLSNCPYLSGLNISESNIENITNQQWDTVFTEIAGVYDSLQNALSEWNPPVPDTGSYHALHHLAFDKEKTLWESKDGYISAFTIPECTLKGGDAWYKLHSLLPASSTTYQLDTTGCNSPVPREFKSEKQTQIKTLTIYPNPARNHLFIENAGGPDYEIMDTNGRLMQRGELNNKGKVLFNSILETGLYFITVNEQVKRFIIIR